MELTDQEKEILRHALGLNYGDEITRNNSCPSDNTQENNLHKKMVEKELLYLDPKWESYYVMSQGLILYRVTKKGKELC